MIYNILGKNIKYYRIKCNITQEQLSERVNLSVRYMSDLENGKVNVTLSTLISIAKIFNVEVYMLLKDNNYSKQIQKVYKKSKK